MHIASAKLASAPGFRDKSVDAILDNADHASLRERRASLSISQEVECARQCVSKLRHPRVISSAKNTALGGQGDLQSIS